jgi:hypothetical protein
VFYKVVVRAHIGLYRKARESGDFGEGKAKLRWSDGLGMRVVKGMDVASHNRCASANPDSGERDVAVVPVTTALSGSPFDWCAHRGSVRHGDDWL